MKYRVYGEEEDYYSIDDVIEDCISDDYHDDDDYFEEWLNDIYESVRIGGETFTAYQILDGCDRELLYDLRRDYCSEQNDNDRENAKWDLEHADVGDDVYIQNIRVMVLDDDEDEDESAGDYDGDEDRITACRRKIEDQQLRVQQIKANEEAEENELMNLFQVIQ